MFSDVDDDAKYVQSATRKNAQKEENTERDRERERDADREKRPVEGASRAQAGKRTRAQQWRALLKIN